ncbi:helix-turn-helix domain-containing protein [Psychrobacillus sp. FJAT-21963]|uniref:helix-turn-helix domain-containing protein n=1 Tax=Psychrobacillus sp. FJAT-21963 TaxID=1712028 RepID=UPI0006FA3745|nr:helix-turn-helix transcriptional regulator [Psychrobacillus sp. FJAT-21963]KQL12435.1 hypothetical protein AN959_20395 [Psychrobacillus sp. FJAT-21963]
MINYGSTLKKIRKNKGYSQKEVAGNSFAQSTYSNFESNKSDIHSAGFLYLLNQLQLSSDEFEYIFNEYKFDKVTEIKQQFFRLPYNNKHEIKHVINSIDIYLETNQNKFLEELKCICEALLILEISGDLTKAKEKVITVWERLSRYDQWYLMDIKIINVILYFFDDDVAIQVTDKLLERLKTYKGLGDSLRLSLTLTLNLSMILIKNGKYSEALVKLEKLLQQNLHSFPYQSLAVCFNRIAICYSYSNREKEDNYKKKLFNLLEVYDDKLFLNMIQHEYEKYALQKDY